MPKKFRTDDDLYTSGSGSDLLGAITPGFLDYLPEEEKRPEPTSNVINPEVMQAIAARQTPTPPAPEDQVVAGPEREIDLSSLGDHVVAGPEQEIDLSLMPGGNRQLPTERPRREDIYTKKELQKLKNRQSEMEAAMIRARAGRNESDLYANLGQAFSGGLGVASGTKADPALYQALRDQSKANVEGTEKDVNRANKEFQDFLENKLKRENLLESVEARKEMSRENALMRQALLKEKGDEKIQALKTPFGTANTIDDAKQLKTAWESKSNFDNKINELIGLRKQYGGEFLDREAVSRGKQLSKDLLLEYKNMAKLGVLSQSDEKIINAIIPPDPLAFKSPLETIQGQDSILSNLQKFKQDSDKDFATKIQTRIREGGQTAGPNSVNTPETKVVGGKQYKKVPGGWQEVM